MPSPEYLLAYLALGVFVGLLAGLLGIGGGAVMVPILSLMFTHLGFTNDHVIHLAIATSMAAILPGTFASARTHHQHGAVNWTILRQVTPGVVAGTLSGALIAHFLSTGFLKYFFVGFIFFLASQLMLDFKSRHPKPLPGKIGFLVLGLLVGLASSLAGTSGAALMIAFLSFHRVNMQEAIGTSAVVGFPIALIGALSYIGTGLLESGLPSGSLGYVYVPAFVCIALTSITVAPAGARLAHRLPSLLLKRIFMVFIIGLAIKMAVSI